MKTLNVNLEVFQGPMDLLYHLIQKNKIDIYDIPIAELTEQYIEYISNFDNKDADSMSEFIVMASTLLEIKSKMLLPKLKVKEDDEDPREELISKLIEYKRFKEASELFKQKNLTTQYYLYKGSEQSVINLFKVKKAPDVGELLDDISISMLNKIFKDVTARKNLNKNLVHGEYNTLKRDVYKISDKMEHIKMLLDMRTRVNFSQLFEESCCKEEKITGFIAVLELVRLQEATVVQNKIFDEITIVKN